MVVQRNDYRLNYILTALADYPRLDALRQNARPVCTENSIRRKRRERTE